jgi:hypothetical protein
VCGAEPAHGVLAEQRKQQSGAVAPLREHA